MGSFLIAKLFPLRKEFLFWRPMRTLSASKREGFLACIPYRLEIEGRRELTTFPLNVLFPRHAIRDEEEGVANALYVPDFSSFSKEGQVYSMIYRNIHGGDCHLVITYGETDGSYKGEKFINGKSVGFAVGKEDWDNFFIHLTLLGISDGESCDFKTMEEFRLYVRGEIEEPEESTPLKLRILNLVLRTLRWMPFGS